MTLHALTACGGLTHRLCWPDSTQRGIGHLVLLNLTRGVLPADVQAVGCGVVHLDVPGWCTGHCKRPDRSRESEVWKEQQYFTEIRSIKKYETLWCPKQQLKLMDLQTRVIAYLKKKKPISWKAVKKIGAQVKTRMRLMDQIV